MLNGTNQSWILKIADILQNGEYIFVRGAGTHELLHDTLCFDMANPIITVPERKLNYRFMAAEALWMLSGSNELWPLTKHVKRMVDYSDDGKTLAGAYGPRILAQIYYVVKSLFSDRFTRQSVITIWDRNPKVSKDIACTISMQFLIRQDELIMSVSMRSSDIWLGIPYDLFSFSMVGNLIAILYNQKIINDGLDYTPIKPGRIFITAGSRHLYDTNQTAAESVVHLARKSDTTYMMPTFNSSSELVGWLSDMEERGLEVFNA